MQWSTTFFTYDVRDGIIVGGAKLVVQNDKLKDLKIEKPLPLLDLSKYKVDTTCQELLTELTKLQTKKKKLFLNIWTKKNKRRKAAQSKYCV